MNANGWVQGDTDIALPLADRLRGLGFGRYLALAAVAAFSGSLALLGAAAVAADALGLGVELPPSLGVPDGWTIFGTVLFAPLAETLLLIALLKILASIGLRAIPALLASAVLWGLLHGTLSPLRFFGSVWSFFVFGYGYVLWRRQRRWTGFAAAAVPHMIINAGAIAVQFLPDA